MVTTVANVYGDFAVFCLFKVTENFVVVTLNHPLTTWVSFKPCFFLYFLYWLKDLVMEACMLEALMLLAEMNDRELW